MAEFAGWIEQRRGDLVELLQALIRARSENPPGDETAVATIVRERLKAAGADVRTSEPAPGRVSVIGVVEGTESGPVIMCDAHLDTVPAGPGWTVDPFAGDVRDGFVYGRGAVDHKSPVAALIYALLALRAQDQAHGRVVVVFDADEEEGGELGMRALLPRLQGCVDMALYAVPTSYTDTAADFFRAGRDNVFNGSAGLLRFRVSYDTERAYQVAPAEWWYPAEVGARVHARLGKELPAPDWFGPRPRARLRAQSDGEQSWEVFALPDESLVSLEQVVRRVVVDEVASLAGVTAGVEILSWVPPASCPPDHRLVTALVESATVASGRVPHVGPLPALTGMSVIQEGLGVPIAAFGYGDLELCHTPDERIAVDDLVAASVAYAELLTRLA